MQNYLIKWNGFSLKLGKKTSVMGILNTTPDSFSDGGKFFACDAAIDHGLRLVNEGADILDIGGESSRPFSEPVSADEEMHRVIPVIERLSEQIDVPISIDTTKAEVAEQAIKAGASIINDISALNHDSKMAEIAAKNDVPVILMHMKGKPGTMQLNPYYDNLMKEIMEFLTDRVDYALKSGIRKENIILDPGIGFGKTIEHNLMLIKHLKKINKMGFPVLIGPSRKSFIQKILSNLNGKKITADAVETDKATLAAVAASVLNGAHIVRVHDVASVKPMIQIIDAIMNI